MVRDKKTMGTVVLVSALANQVHPSKNIREKRRNIRNGMRDYYVIQCKVKKISQKDQEAIILPIMITGRRMASYLSYMLANGAGRFFKRIIPS